MFGMFHADTYGTLLLSIETASAKHAHLLAQLRQIIKNHCGRDKSFKKKKKSSIQMHVHMYTLTTSVIHPV